MKMYKRIFKYFCFCSPKEEIDIDISIKKKKKKKKSVRFSEDKYVSQSTQTEETSFNKNEEKSTQTTKIETLRNKRKKQIPATLKRMVWNTYIGEDIGKSKCFCCDTTYITQLSFHCGHYISEHKGGEMILSNLRPICQNCNSSMNVKNMDDFMNILKIEKKPI